MSPYSARCVKRLEPEFTENQRIWYEMIGVQIGRDGATPPLDAWE